MEKVTPFIWFNDEAEEAAKFYLGVFKDARIVNTMQGPGNTIISATIELSGRQYILFNGGPMFTINEAFSLFVSCDTQEEIDDKWEKLIANGGSESRCGWLKDRFGISWQLIPPVLGKLLGDKDRAKAKRVMEAMLKMKKIVIADLEKAAAN